MTPIPCPWTKRITDVALSSLMLILCAPVMLLIALLITLAGWMHAADRGPVLRYEIRYSAGRPFRCYKFRVMRQAVLNAATPVRSLKRAKALERDANCTVIGRWIKQWYLDELPQLYHIWRGDMRVVGPRPFRAEDYEAAVRDHYIALRCVRAGLTGPLQIHKGLGSRQSKHALEMEYMAQCRALSPWQLWWYDLGIIGKTFRVVAQHKGL